MINSEIPDSSDSRFLNFFPSHRYFILFILVIFIMATLTSGLIFRKQENSPISIVPTPPPLTQLSQMIIFGVWKDNQSVIKSYDISLRKEYLLAKLPFNIKKVTVLSPSEILYIGETNDKDHGKTLSVYNLSTKQTDIIYQSDENFGIDDYVISKDKRYSAIWEVSFKEESNVLLNGRSRVVAIDLSNPGLKNLIYDEIANTPIHYPRAITQNGTIFLDTFLPNSGAGWSYGLSISNFTGSQKQDLSNMKNGTYATQPSISKDEDYLVFSGYSFSDGATTENGFRKALISPNTIELLNTQTLERAKLPNIPDTNIYPFSFFDLKTGEIIFSSIEKEKKDVNTYSYNLLTKVLTKIETKDAFITGVSQNKILTGENSQSVSSLGNLGDNYKSTFNSFSILDLPENRILPLKLTDSFLQYITIVPSSFFTDKTEINISDKTLQLQTFNFKPSLASKREGQQSELIPPDDTPVDSKPPCLQLLLNQCASMNSSDSDIRSQQRAAQCRHDMERMSNQGICSDSPLYLYGKAGTSVNIKVNSYVYSSDPLYDEKTGYNVTLLDNGKMKVDGKIYDRINYDYLSQKVSPPNYGIVVSKGELKNTLVYFAKNLGLNQKETDDLIYYADINIKSPFIFVSFYDQKTSEQILPLEFSPKPDTYLNIVFYFKEYNKFPSISPISPTFPNIPNRIGLTAVEISEIVDRESKK